jgi:hypothetical protein
MNVLSSVKYPRQNTRQIFTAPPTDYVASIPMNVSTWIQGTTKDATNTYILFADNSETVNDTSRGYVLSTYINGNYGIRLESPIQNSFCTTNYTYCFWFKITSALSTTRKSGLVGDYNGINCQFNCYFNTTGNICVTHGSYTNVDVDVLKYTGVTYTSTSDWTHVAVTYTNSNRLMSLYVNGVNVSTLTKASPSVWTGISGGKTCFGYGRFDANLYGYAGTMDNIKVYSRALSSAEISNMYSYEFYNPRL